MKRATILSLVLGAFSTFASASQIQGFVSGYAAGNIDEKKYVGGVETTSSQHTDFTWGLGAEFLAFPVGPLMVGGGLGYFSMQKDGGNNIVMTAVPVWAYLGAIAPESWPARPYVGARVGYPIAATEYATWWDKPFHFFVTGNVGVQFPFHVGLEIDCTYLTMNKYFKPLDGGFRVTSVKFGGSITFHFDLSGNSAEPEKAPEEDEKPAAKTETENFSYGYSYSDENENTESSYSDPYSSYSEQPAEEPAESAAEPEESAEQASEEPVADESSSEEPSSSDTDSAPADEASSDEAPAEEAAAEPSEESPAEEVAEAAAEEPAAEPAPEPEPVAKKVSKKTSKKKSSKKSKSKKTSKKSTAKSKKRR